MKNQRRVARQMVILAKTKRFVSNDEADLFNKATGTLIFERKDSKPYIRFYEFLSQYNVGLNLFCIKGYCTWTVILR